MQEKYKTMPEDAQAEILRATKRGTEAPRSLVVPFSEIHNEIISDVTSDDRRKELQKEMKKRIREMEEVDIVRWRDIQAGVLKRIKENKWDDVYPALMNYARSEEDTTRGININIPDRMKYNGVVQSAIEMASLQVSTQGMRRVSGRPDFESWLAAHGKTKDELEEDERIVERGSIVDFHGIDLPDLVGESIEEEEAPLEKVLAKIKPREEMILITKPKKELLKTEEWEKLDEGERELVISLLKGYMKGPVKLVGGNKNIYIRNGSPVDFAVSDINEEEDEFRERILLKLKGEVPGRAEVVLARMVKIREWVEGNAALLNAAGPMLEYFYDGLRGLGSTLSTPDYLRYDVTTDELHKMYTALGELSEGMLGPDGEWKLGKEIINKQDQIYAIFRGIAAVHRHRGRNLGKAIVAQHEGKDSSGKKANFTDYPVTEKQIEFIEKVFAGKTTVPRTIRVNGEEQDVWIESPEFVDVIAEIITRDNAIAKLKKFFDDSSNTSKLRRIVAGEEVEITEKWLKKDLKKLIGQSIWVYGAEWKVTEDNLDKLREKLEWRIGSEDKVFVGKDYQVTKGNLKDAGGQIKTDEKVALIKTRPGTIDNLFVMGQDPHTVSETKQKLAVMLNMGLGEDSLWERLKDTSADVDQLYKEFELAWEEYRSKGEDLLDEHIIDTARIALLYYCEGANLGWGFEYEEDKDLGITERKVSSGGTKAATDMSTPLFWLQTEASNTWKDWSIGPLPMDKNVARRILDHEPGWVPNKDAQGNWNLNYLNQPLDLRVPAKFELTMLNSATIRSGEHEKRKALDLVYDGKYMSQVPWRRIISGAPYSWYVTINQAAPMIALLSKIPDRDTIAALFGGSMTSARTIELLTLMKKQSLAHRDAGKIEHVKEFLPLSVSTNLAWQNNMLPRSLKPGIFSDTLVSIEEANTEQALATFAPEGDRAAAQEMVSRFRATMSQYKKIGDLMTQNKHLKAR